jgi:ATP-dependent Lon protease
MTANTRKFERAGIGVDRKAKEAVDAEYRYLKAAGRNISRSISTNTKDYLMHVHVLNGIGMTKSFKTLPAFVIFALSLSIKSLLAAQVERLLRFKNWQTLCRCAEKYYYQLH